MIKIYDTAPLHNLTQTTAYDKLKSDKENGSALTQILDKHNCVFQMCTKQKFEGKTANLNRVNTH